MTASLSPAPAASSICDFEQTRFDRALALLNDADPRARVALDAETGLAVGADVSVTMPMPAAARVLPMSDRSAAAAVLFIDRFGPMFGVAGWHVLEPRFASPIGTSIWLTFAAQTSRGELLVNVCVDGEVVKNVRIER